jgi:hypothetical protein
MFESKCSFAITLIKEDFACEQAQIVTRRAGPDIACASNSASRRCMDVLSAFKMVGLPAFDAEDDLIKTPHSIFSKIQFGGLLGLSKDIENSPDIERVENIYQLVEQAIQQYRSVDAIPHYQYVSFMTEFKIRRKRRVK